MNVFQRLVSHRLYRLAQLIPPLREMNTSLPQNLSSLHEKRIVLICVVIEKIGQ